MKIAYHVSDPRKSQLIMYVGGEGGTGKSRIINCVTALFEEIDPDGLHKMAFTGTAAYNIGGRTIHSSIRKTKGSRRKKIEKESDLRHKESNRSFWKTKTCAIVDEITFAPEAIMNDHHNVLCSAKGISDTDGPQNPFGGMHVIMFGDFFQHLAIGKRIYESFLWNRLTNSLILTEQVRAKDD